MNSQLIYYIERGKYKDIIRDDKLLFRCPYCGEWYKGLAYHTNQKHGITGKELRKRMGLMATYQLITPDIKERHRETALRDNMGDQLRKVGKDTRYVKGAEGHKEWSPQAIVEIQKRSRKRGKFK